MTTPRPFWIVALALLLALASCSQPSRDDKITATNDAAFEQWIADHRDALTLQDIDGLNEARQQLRFKVMTARPGLQPDAFAEALYADINGHTVNEVLIAGCELQIQRVETELKNYDPMVQKLRSYDGNGMVTADQKASIAQQLEQLNGKIAARKSELEKLQQRLAALKSGQTGT